MRALFRMMFCTIDDWIELSMEDIRRMEDEATRILKLKINQRNDNKTQF
jgi:Phosphatidylinositol transfer protein